MPRVNFSFHNFCLTEFEKGLANGVLIAEILRKYGVLSDDEFISLRHNKLVIQLEN